MQNIVIAGLSKLGIIHPIGSWSGANVEKGIQDLLICLEMFIISVVHTRAFPAKPYEDGTVQHDGSSLLEAHFAHHTAIRDFNEARHHMLNGVSYTVEAERSPVTGPPPKLFVSQTTVLLSKIRRFFPYLSNGVRSIWIGMIP